MQADGDGRRAVLTRPAPTTSGDGMDTALRHALITTALATLLAANPQAEGGALGAKMSFGQIEVECSHRNFPWVNASCGG